MASANFRIGYSIVGSTGPWTWAAYGACVDVAASAWIKVELESTAGVATINATIPRADEVVMAAGVPTVTIDQVTRTAVFQMPAYASVCCIEVTTNPSSTSSVVAALAVHVLTAGSRRLLALDETTEQHATYKWLSKINAIIRAGASSGAASAISTDTSAFDKILSTADDTVQKALNTIDEHTHSSTESEVASVESTVSSEGSTRASADASVASTVSSEGSTRASADSAVSSESISRNASVAASSLSRDTSLESQASSADVSLTTRLSDEESTRTSQIASVAAAAGGGGIYDEVITRTGTLTDANWTNIGAVYTMDASKVTSFTIGAVARDAGTIDGAYARYKCACICDGADAHFIGEAAATTTSVMSLIAGDDGDDGGSSIGFGVRAVISGLTIQFQAQASLYPGDITVRLRIGIIEDS